MHLDLTATCDPGLGLAPEKGMGRWLYRTFLGQLVELESGLWSQLECGIHGASPDFDHCTVECVRMVLCLGNTY